MNKKLFLGMFLLLLFSSLASATVYFETDFENYSIGNLSGQDSWTGTSTQYIDVYNSSGDFVVRTRDAGATIVNIQTVTLDSFFEVLVNFSTNGVAWGAGTSSVIFNLRANTPAALVYLACDSTNDDLKVPNGGGFSTVKTDGCIETSEVQIKFEIDDTADTFDVWYNGTEVLTGQAFANSGDVDDVIIVGHNEAGGNVQYFDDLCVADDVDTECFVSGTPTTYTAYEHFDIEIPTVTVNSATDILLDNTTVTVGDNRTLLFRGAINTIGTLPASSGTAFVRVDVDGTTVYNESIRTFSGNSEYGVASIFFSYNLTTTNATIETYARETSGAGGVSLSNFELHALSTTSTNGSAFSYTDISGSDTKVLNTTYQEVYNLTSLDTVTNSSLLIDLHIKMNATGESMPDCELRNPENVALQSFKTYLSDSTKIRSSGVGVIDTAGNRSGNVTYTIWCKDDYNQTVTGVVEGYILGLKDNDGNVVNFNQTSSENITLTNSNTTILNILNYQLNAGSGAEISTTASFNSGSGLHTPYFWIGYDGTVTGNYYRTVQATDWATVRFGGHYINTTSTNYSLNTNITAGENITGDFLLHLYDVEELNTSVANLNRNDLSSVNLSTIGTCQILSSFQLNGSITCDVTSVTNCTGSYYFANETGCTYSSGQTGSYNIAGGETINNIATVSCNLAQVYNFTFNATQTDGQSLQSTTELECTSSGGGLTSEESDWLEGIYNEVIGMGLIIVVLALLGLGLAFRNGLIVSISGIGMLAVGNQLLNTQNWLFSAFLFMLGLFLFIYGFWLGKE